MAHAYAFVGPEGSAEARRRRVRQGLVAPAGGGAAARIERGVHPDVRMFEPTPPENKPKALALRIESVRARALAALRPMEASRKVFIERGGSDDHRHAAGFLKTLEERPSGP